MLLWGEGRKASDAENLICMHLGFGRRMTQNTIYNESGVVRLFSNTCDWSETGIERGVMRGLGSGILWVTWYSFQTHFLHHSLALSVESSD